MASSASASPGDLALVYAAREGDGENRGLNHFAEADLEQRIYRNFDETRKSLRVRDL